MYKPQQIEALIILLLVTFLFLDAEPEFSLICFYIVHVCKDFRLVQQIASDRHCIVKLVPFFYWDLYFNNVIRASWQWIVLTVSLTLIAHA